MDPLTCETHSESVPRPLGANNKQFVRMRGRAVSGGHLSQHVQDMKEVGERRSRSRAQIDTAIFAVKGSRLLQFATAPNGKRVRQ